MLELTDVHKHFQQADGAVRVLDGLSTSLAPGRSAALLGESGSGKSTLLHLIAGLDSADSGRIVLDGTDTSAFKDADWAAWRRDKLSLIFQNYHLVPTLTVADNLALQARLAGRFDGDFYDHLVARLGLSDLLKRLPHQLSGGQQQRVAIGRALLHRPALVLADEPTGNLDERSSAAVMALLTELVREAGASLLMVTHSPAMAAHLDERWQLTNGRLETAA
ncbi:ABC transporter ATP-binding protein [Saccharospirillum sp. MSK14-1]|uniref:ABC transporter ATP-binding protein n=1 Tax=Saccharospirillum sp. MSK14-1 TaxID=1897632 RepID=UPI000D39F86C|nr:ABC transporter ATP-binding protein [Saccharospirillum sp. MSK14-1]PTY37206.1 ABC transporter ATP-binding protein [Saccharospirillum sp. MSK14-1]